MSAEFPVIAIGASAGALDAVRRITEALARDCAAAIVVVFHEITLASQRRKPQAGTRLFDQGQGPQARDVARRKICRLGNTERDAAE
jgi:hypothetical protein